MKHQACGRNGCFAGAMQQAILYGFISGFALLLGSLAGLYLRMPHRVIALIMAFGCGVLTSALSIDLMSDAFEATDKPLIVGVSFLAGALMFVVGDALIDSLGGQERKTVVHKQHRHHDTTEEPTEKSASGNAILLGTLLDGIPESLVMGATLAIGGTGGLVFVAAVFLSNFPEGISGSIAMKNNHMKPLRILAIWGSMVVVTMICTAIGYHFLGDAPAEFKAASMAFASGAILAMLSDTMFPEAFREGGRLTGFVVAAGFLTAFLLTKVSE
ncbi:MAG: hypothetical protein IT269_05230 [Saprospiraceae bacterium]|nr:hypothetical protein [Saprospiraceae bacterium]